MLKQLDKFEYQGDVYTICDGTLDEHDADAAVASVATLGMMASVYSKSRGYLFSLERADGDKVRIFNEATEEVIPPVDAVTHILSRLKKREKVRVYFAHFQEGENAKQ